MIESGTIIKALSGFYYVHSGGETVRCRARGRFRRDGTSPLVGDHVSVQDAGNGEGYVSGILPRTNRFVRPAVANVDYLVVMAANVNPVTDPYLIDRVAVIAEHTGCGVIVCVNKCDLDPGDELCRIYRTTGYRVIRTSAVTGEGIPELREAISGRISAFTGNSGVGKSSVLNALDPDFRIETGEVSEKLGRGRHTTRHVELYDLGGGTLIADTPGFASFDFEQMTPILKQELQRLFPEFRPYIGRCRFDDCAHLREPGCAVREALASGAIDASRYASYCRLYELSSHIKEWELDGKK